MCCEKAFFPLFDHLAPSLVDSNRVHGNPQQLVPLFFHGLMGPIKGKTYLAGYMAPAKTFGIEREDRLAELLSYIRYASVSYTHLTLPTRTLV